MEDNRLIIKAKISPDGVEIRWVDKGKDAIEHSLRSGDKPLPRFKDALADLVPDVVNCLHLFLLICQPLLAEGRNDRLTVRGVTVTWNHDIMGACITALGDVDGSPSPVVVNTPHLPESPYSGSDDDPNPTLPPSAATKIDTVIEEAKMFLDGERVKEQKQLFDEEGSSK